MKCLKCGYEWTPRVKNPKACPECKIRLKKNTPGVTWSKALSKYKVTRQVDSKDVHVGFFKNIDEAVAALQTAQAKHQQLPSFM